MSRIAKIKLCLIVCIILVFFLFIGSIIIAIIPSFYLESSIIEIVCFFIISIPLLFASIFIIEFLAKKLLQRYKADIKVKQVNVAIASNKKFNSFLSVDNTVVYFKNIHHLKTVSEFFIDSLTVEECKIKRKKNNQFIKRKFSKANETISSKKHWIYQINLFKFDSEDIDKISDLIITLNNDELYEIGRINFGYSIKNNILVIRKFDCDGQVDMISFFRYVKLLKLFCKVYGISYKWLLNQL